HQPGVVAAGRGEETHPRGTPTGIGQLHGVSGQWADLPLHAAGTTDSSRGGENGGNVCGHVRSLSTPSGARRSGRIAGRTRRSAPTVATTQNASGNGCPGIPITARSGWCRLTRVLSLGYCRV